MSEQPINPILRLLQAMTPEQRCEFARAAVTTVNYLYHLGGGSRQPKLVLGLRIEDASRQMTAKYPSLPSITAREIAAYIEAGA